MSKIIAYAAFALFALSLPANASPPDDTQLAVWANEAIVATYSFSYNNFLQRQKEIAKYFTAAGWTAYSEAIIASKLPEAVQANQYNVSAVATQPPKISKEGVNKWAAKMPILVVYENPQYQQKQNLELIIHFTQAPSGQGVRGFTITSLQAKAIKPPCRCQTHEEGDTATTGAQR